MITTHVLDLREGGPAPGLRVVLERRDADSWQPAGEVTTDANGRAALEAPEAGIYRLRFDTGSYWEALGVDFLHPEVTVMVHKRTVGRLHLPLLLSPFGYTTYRGT